MKPNSLNKKYIESIKQYTASYRLLNKTLSFMAQGIGAVWKLDPTDQYTISFDTKKYYDESRMSEMESSSLGECIKRDNRN